MLLTQAQYFLRKFKYYSTQIIIYLKHFKTSYICKHMFVYWIVYSVDYVFQKIVFMYWSFRNDTNSKICNQIAKTSCYFIPNICILSNIKDKNMFVITINSWKHVTKGRMRKREIQGAWIKRAGWLRPFLEYINLLGKKSSVKRCRQIFKF